jgi:eukaryotic-like serine/threonine-protein kinase
MPIESVDIFLSVLRRVQLLTAEQAAEVQRELGSVYTDPFELGAYLVEVDWITAYQLKLIFEERWDDLNIGPYQILDLLGEGGVSEVFKAWDTLRGRIVALKVLRHHLADKSDMLRQFQRELQAVTRLSHPNIIKTFDAHQVGCLHYFAMEYVEGMDLARFVGEVGALSLEMTADFGRQVAQGLQHAHQLGLVHRDIKPANLFLLNPPLPATANTRRPDPVMKIIDWGLARCLRDPATAVANVPSAAEMDEERGSLIGTADFIAPEQAQDPTLVDIRADIYSLGCTLYYLLTAQPPFPGSSLYEKLLQHREQAPPSLRTLRPDVPEEFDGILQKMMAKAPEDRFQIPLLLVTPLRRFCPGAMTGTASLIRPAGGSGPTSRPISSPNIAPPSSAAISRPGSMTNIPRPGEKG